MYVCYVLYGFIDSFLLDFFYSFAATEFYKFFWSLSLYLSVNRFGFFARKRRNRWPVMIFFFESEIAVKHEFIHSIHLVMIIYIFVQIKWYIEMVFYEEKIKVTSTRINQKKKYSKILSPELKKWRWMQLIIIIENLKISKKTQFPWTKNQWKLSKDLS